MTGGLPVALRVPPRRTPWFAGAVPPLRWTVGPLNIVGFYVGSCGDFNILADYGVHSEFTLFFDKDGTPGERELNQIDATTGIVATTAASFKVVLPGNGVIFMNAARVVMNLATREIYFEAGQQQWYEGDFEAFCSALRP